MQALKPFIAGLIVSDGEQVCVTVMTVTAAARNRRACATSTQPHRRVVRCPSAHTPHRAVNLPLAVAATMKAASGSNAPVQLQQPGLSSAAVLQDSTDLIATASIGPWCRAAPAHDGASAQQQQQQQQQQDRGGALGGAAGIAAGTLRPPLEQLAAGDVTLSIRFGEARGMHMCHRTQRAQRSRHVGSTGAATAGWVRSELATRHTTQLRSAHAAVFVAPQAAGL
jgi:hypothetical protein